MAREIGRLDAETFIKFALIMLVEFAVIISNIVVLFVSLVDRRLRRHRSSHFIVSLGTADLFVGIFLFPIAMVMTLINTDYRHEIITRICVFGGMTGLNASFYTLLGIFIDKYIGIVKPLQYNGLVTTNRCRVITIVIWVLSAVLTIPVLTGWSKLVLYTDSYVSNIQLGIRNPHSVILAVFVYIPVAMTIVILYLHILIISRRHIRQIKTEERRFNSETSLRNKGIYEESTLSRMLLIVTVTLFACWGPCAIYAIYRASSGSSVPVPWIEFVTTWLGFAHSFMNCIIHSILNPHFRKTAANQLACCICCWQKRDEGHMIWMTPLSSQQTTNNGSDTASSNTNGKHTSSHDTGSLNRNIKHTSSHGNRNKRVQDKNAAHETKNRRRHRSNPDTKSKHRTKHTDDTRF